MQKFCRLQADKLTVNDVVLLGRDMTRPPFFSKDLTRNPFFARHVVNLICFTLDDFSNKGVGVKVFCFNLGGNWYRLLEPRKNDGTMKLVHNT